jgi:hypothetical protein
MRITIDISEEGLVTTHLERAQASVLRVPFKAEASEAESYDAGSAPVGLEGPVGLEKVSSEAESYDAGSAPVGLEGPVGLEKVSSEAESYDAGSAPVGLED